ncbi:MAG: hypothetical protein HN764_10385 [Gammaproteobacteria bacterium]|nr:hypothetical protein [Gammaproteobacteria bacterium]
MTEHELTPPAARTGGWQAISEAASTGDFILQVCESCESVQYPPRELCGNCLKDELEWKQVSNKGRLISNTVLHASTNAFFRAYGPRQIALVKLDSGAVLFAHMAHNKAQPGDNIYLLNRLDLSGEGVFIAIIEGSDEKTQLDEFKILLLQNN